MVNLDDVILVEVMANAPINITVFRTAPDQMAVVVPPQEITIVIEP